MSRPLSDRLREIEVLVMDVDGVLTNGQIIYSDAGHELQIFHSCDGAGLSLWRKTGKRSAVITGRGSKALERRAAELHVDVVLQHVKNKKSALGEVFDRLHVEARQTATIGDDLPDLPMLRLSGVAFSVADACAEVRAAADEVTLAGGGQGAVREVVERILKAQNRWADLVTSLNHSE
jgi:3-deoxy-D-manno-octulosonate 8-phosphate phosphatase (KDO 8-P phosphatase)